MHILSSRPGKEISVHRSNVHVHLSILSQACLVADCTHLNLLGRPIEETQEYRLCCIETYLKYVVAILPMSSMPTCNWVATKCLEKWRAIDVSRCVGVGGTPCYICGKDPSRSYIFRAWGTKMIYSVINTWFSLQRPQHRGVNAGIKMLVLGRSTIYL